jgi:uncharacterized membrane protein
MENLINALLIVTLIGIANTIYLTYCSIAKVEVKCLFLPAEMCVKVQHSKYSRTMGIPNPYLGLAMLLIILTLILLFMQSLVPFWWIFAVITFGFLFSFYFFYIQAYVIKAYCTWCILSAFVFMLLFLISLKIQIKF